eukprot:TRINITY_DN2473_c1_g2_i1.p1 TRINITY_DN2473_c1_g2~~TRINITY_DN2473_c1_g2_i1.p1  ORF type:complete len:472 (+),score=54.49 TRINITY_DN2473_c1_g2_i1:60-1475(+)
MGKSDSGKEGFHQNPFTTNSEEPSWYNVSQLVFPGIVLIPLRIFLCLFISVFLWTCAVWILCTAADVQKQGLQGASRCGLLIARCLLRCLLFVIGVYWIDVEGEYAGHRAAPIIVANHTAWLDGMVLTWVCFGSPITKVQITHLPYIGIMIRAIQAVVVDQASPDSRTQVMDEIKRRAADDTYQYPVLIFPEGACTNQKSIIQFQQGAFKCGVPVQPIALSYGCNNLDVTWVWGTTWTTWFTFLSQWTIPVKVRILPPVQPVDDPIHFAEITRNKIKKKLKVTCTQHNLKDVLLSGYMVNRGYHPSMGVIEFGKLREMYPNVQVEHYGMLVHLFCSVSDIHPKVGNQRLTYAGYRSKSYFTLSGWSNMLHLEQDMSKELLNVFGNKGHKRIELRDLIYKVAPIIEENLNIAVPEVQRWDVRRATKIEKDPTVKKGPSKEEAVVTSVPTSLEAGSHIRSVSEILFSYVQSQT